MHPGPMEASVGSGLPQHHSTSQVGQSLAGTRTGMWLSPGGSLGLRTSSASPSTGLSCTPPGRLCRGCSAKLLFRQASRHAPSKVLDKLRLEMSFPLS